MTLQQDPRSLAVATPLGEDVLVLTRFEAREEISRLFSLQLEMVSERTSIEPSVIVGQNVTVAIKTDTETKRYFNGYVKRFTTGYDEKNKTVFRAEVVPWTWFLSRTSDCRIFQNLTAPQIIEKIFGDLGFTDFELDIRGEHKEWEYCVQYRETDFDFISRLMEHEGIFYFFRHENGKHTMVLADRESSYKPLLEDKVRCPLSRHEVANDRIDEWEHQFEFVTGKWTQTDYDFKKPKVSLASTVNTIVELPGINSFERYDYPGQYVERRVGDTETRTRMEETEVGYDVVRGTGTYRSFVPGGTFTLVEHSAENEQGKSYVLTTVYHSASADNYGTGDGGSHYSNRFECIPDTVVFRPARLTPIPKVVGVQTAVVVGPSGEEIYCDEFGRIKVQFHWDREGKSNENSSCWIRCMQSSAGNTWGTVFLPRIGQEVVVDFLEGDPNRPIVIGLAYNAIQMPHYKLPDEKSKSYIKTNSTPGGSGHNEIRFEDKAGKEQIFIRGQKDFDQRVLNMSREFVGADRHSIVKGNQKAKVDADNHLTVGGKQLEKIDGDMSLQVGMKRHTKVGMVDASEAGQEIHLKAGMKVIIEAGMQISLKGPGGFIDIGPAGVTIQGTMVKVNSGGSAGSGSGAKPVAPETPDEADDSKSGRKSNS